MYNARYHIASLVAVFLALSLGLVLGGLVVRTGTVGRQQAALVQGLRKEFTDLRNENGQLSSDNALLGAYSNDMTNEWVSERLVGRTIVVLTSSAKADGLVAVRDAVRSAGGQLAVITINKPGLGLDDPAVRSQLGTVAAGEAAGASGRVAEALAREWTVAGQPRPVTSALASAGVVAVEGLNAADAVTGVIDLASAGPKPDAVAVGVVKAVDALGYSAIGAESPGTPTGIAVACVQQGASGFDTLGSDVGRYTLIALLTGADPGLYGTSKDALAKFPSVISK